MQKSKVVFVDVDTQRDFMCPDGALYVKGAESIIPNLKKLIYAALKAGIPIISSADKHTERDEEMDQFPPHCIGGTEGQKKIPETITSGLITLPNRPYTGDFLTLFDHYDQVVLQKSKLDLFTNCNTEPLLSQLFADDFVVFGVATDYCVRMAVLGLLQREKKVTLVLDAIRAVDEAAGEAAVAEMLEKGAQQATTPQVLART